MWQDPPDPPALAPGHVHVWRIPQGEPEAARAGMRAILARYKKVPQRDLLFARHGHGKPYFKDDPIEFNLAHSGDVALLAVAERTRVGVDLEKWRGGINAEGIAERFFTGQESRTIQSRPAGEKLRAFYSLWTRKEAVIKAMGGSVMDSLGKFDLTGAPEPLATLSIHGTQWTVMALPMGPQYSAGLAVEGAALNSLRLWRFMPMTQMP